jgi:2-oxoglutarate dehydrogenase E2 component (dihydrolipoamide succinyltransferase)
MAEEAGDAVKADEPIASLETDKVAIDVPRRSPERWASSSSRKATRSRSGGDRPDRARPGASAQAPAPPARGTRESPGQSGRPGETRRQRRSDRAEAEDEEIFDRAA